MSSMFAKTAAKGISVYRQMLRRYLSTNERAQKLADLNLKDPAIYEDDALLYQTALNIVVDIEKNMDTSDEGYYAYSGIGQFCQDLRDFLNSYIVENGEVIHKAQKASRSLILAIQIMALPDHQLDARAESQLKHCAEIVAEYGSDEQQEMYHKSLSEHTEINNGFYLPLLQHYEQLVGRELQEAS